VNESRNQRLRRARPVLVLATVAFAVGAVFGARHTTSPANALAERFAAAWTQHDYLSMYSDISESSRRSTPVSEFADAYQQALSTATATHLTITGKARSAPDGRVTVPVRVDTRLFGALSLDFTMNVIDGPEGSPRVVWSRSLAFPGLRSGELLSRNMSLPRRATLLARDGSILAESPPGNAPEQAGETTRTSPLGDIANAVLGTIGPAPASRRQALEAQGVPAQTTVGVSGLELALDDRLRGTAGGELLAGRRLLAYAEPRAAPPVRTTISPTLQRAAVTALGGRYGGIIAMRPATGEILAMAGIGLDGLQPPGSTFKIVTTTGVLAAKIATAHTVFAYATFATLDGVKLNNANGEDCGGTLELAFAVSCNSVFTPLGVKLGAARLVATAERFGFNHEPGIAGAAKSTLPPASQIQGELDIGSTAIGQGQVLATPLEMAIVAATVADGGRRPQPTFRPVKVAAGAPVMGSSVARTMRRLMIGVVREGTGTAAAIPGVTVAGKTGTAELKTACKSSSSAASTGETSATEAHEGGKEGEAGKEGCHGSESEAANTDAWFAAFAPAPRPRIVVCVLLVKDGAGGATAAPVAREVLEAGLAEH
jgi:Penicillin binding protein transpeptidase domain/Penicillin-binding Protein dimerisation domain/NTF2-like N-terminal transpeptidase domain